MSQSPWSQLDPTEIRRLFGTTTVHEKPLAFRAGDGEHMVVLRGELDEAGNENLWWSLSKVESGEIVELARNYGVEEVDGDVVEVSWDGLFPSEWVDHYASGKLDWIKISVTEILEKFGDTVEFEQPQAWRHRDGEFYLVLVGESDEETEEEEYAWSLVREQCGEYVEVATCHPDNEFGAEELRALIDEDAAEHAGAPSVHAEVTTESVAAEEGHPVMLPPPDSILEDGDEEALFDGWWELPPYDWGDRMVKALSVV
ncbi:MAG: hypothetical protein RL173_1363 [Fibrobacterota bacterium]|jgi:hypothetical protein